ncbi:MAG: hypothetical protein ACKVH8_15065 [Pirellulales bacterium]
MNDPIAYFLTWPTYGTWLPGDIRGWIEYRHGWLLPNTTRLQYSEAKLKDDACILNDKERRIVEGQVAETCRFRDWILYGVSCRSNHMHLVIGAENTRPEKIRVDIKSWCTRRMNELSDRNRGNWWAERGSQRYIFDEDCLGTVIQYVTDAQERKDRDLS